MFVSQAQSDRFAEIVAIASWCHERTLPFWLAMCRLRREYQTSSRQFECGSVCRRWQSKGIVGLQDSETSDFKNGFLHLQVGYHLPKQNACRQVWRDKCQRWRTRRHCPIKLHTAWSCRRNWSADHEAARGTCYEMPRSDPWCNKANLLLHMAMYWLPCRHNTP